MKTKTFHVVTAFFAHLIAVTVILSHAHFADVVKHSSPEFGSVSIKSSTDVNAKAIGDLHNHIDKTSLKNVMKSAADTTAAARRRNLSSTLFEEEDSLFDRFITKLLLLRIALTLPVRAF